LRGQARAILMDLVNYYQLFVVLQGAILGAVVTLLLLSGKGRSGIRNFAEYAFLFVPPLAAFGMYALVLVEPRYVAGFVVLFWLAILLGIRLPASADLKRVATAVTISILVALSVQMACKTAKDFGDGISDSQKVQWVVAAKLKQMGVAPGDTVASAGNTFDAAWAHIAEVSIVAETPDYGTESFSWAVDPQAKAQVFQAFAKTGAKAIVADRMPVPNWSADWQRVANTSYYVHLLAPSGG